jgi:hypothetical protein
MGWLRKNNDGSNEKYVSFVYNTYCVTFYGRCHTQLHSYKDEPPKHIFTTSWGNNSSAEDIRDFVRMFVS